MISNAPSLPIIIVVCVVLVRAFLGSVLSPQSPKMDPFLWLVAIGVGVGGAVVDYLINHSVIVAAQIEAAAGFGLSTALACIVLYHLTPTNPFASVLSPGGPPNTTTITVPTGPENPVAVAVATQDNTGSAKPASTALVMPGPVLAAATPDPLTEPVIAVATVNPTQPL